MQQQLRDSLLTWLVEAINLGEVEIPAVARRVTLAVGGFLVWGEVITDDEYLKGLDNQTSGEGTPFWSSGGVINYGPVLEHIHLRDATIRAPDGKSYQAELWRGRLAEVSSFHLGQPGSLIE
jgi:hypothetical protein